MFSLKLHINTSFRAYMISEEKFNSLVVRALTKVAKYWVDNFLPLHFEHEAHSRYGYKPRAEYWGSPRRDGSRRPGTNQYKRMGLIPPDGFFNRRMIKSGVMQRGEPGLWTTITPHPAGGERPLDWRGDLKRHLLDNKQLWVDNAKATARGEPGRGICRVDVKLPFPHPVPHDYAGEMVRITGQERGILATTFRQALRAELQASGAKVRSGVTFSRYNYPVLPALGAA